MNHVKIIDKAFTDKQCDSLIKEFNSKIQGTLEKPRNYCYYDIPLEHKLVCKTGLKIVNKYKKDYPEINLTFNSWVLTAFKFQHFKPGKYYNEMHSEQSIKFPRVLSILIYLSNHNCGTEFHNGFMVKSVKGRALLFPAYWTHAHKGQLCPENKSRYVLSSHIIMFNKG
tara:strand:+ start:42 stop:548 length:507 start_codon:yes stop_codon:yes gene_type:complete